MSCAFRDKTIQHFHKKILDQANANFKNLMSMKSAHHMVLDKGKAALICGAGPSLEEHIPFIEAYRDKLTIICCDVALNRIPTITPDVTINLDADGHLIKWDKPRGLLLAPVYAHPDLLAQWPVLDTYYYMPRDLDNPTLCAVESQFGPRFIPISSKSNVGHMAVHIAFRYGFDHIAFTGIDYSYDDKNVAGFYAMSFMNHIARYYQERNLYHLGRGLLGNWLTYDLDRLKSHLEGNNAAQRL